MLGVQWWTVCLKVYCLFNKRVSLHTRGSGDPSSGCIYNTAGSDVSVIEFYSACQNAIYCAVFFWRCMSREPYLSQTEQWWHRSGFSSWQRSQKRIAEETQPIQLHGRQQQLRANTWPQTIKVTEGETTSESLRVSLDCRVPYLQSWCGCRWAGPWLSSSGSPAETLLDLHAPAAPCQSRTGETVWGKAQHVWFINGTVYSWWIRSLHESKQT